MLDEQLKEYRKKVEAAINRRYIGDAIRWNDTPLILQKILLDPQTSGGLLIALPEPATSTLVSRLQSAGIPAVVVGRVTPKAEVALEII